MNVQQSLISTGVSADRSMNSTLLSALACRVTEVSFSLVYLKRANKLGGRI